MTVLPTGEIVIRTLGDLQEHGHSISWYCNNTRCNRSLSLTLEKAIELWGRDKVFVNARWPVKCSACGSRDIGIVKAAPDYRA